MILNRPMVDLLSPSIGFLGLWKERLKLIRRSRIRTIRGKECLFDENRETIFR